MYFFFFLFFLLIISLLIIFIIIIFIIIIISVMMFFFLFSCPLSLYTSTDMIEIITYYNCYISMSKASSFAQHSSYTRQLKT